MAEAIDRVRSALADRYEILRELGRGGMATVYLARDPRHSRLVAIKVLKEELSQGVAADRFFTEITIAAQLVHPHIVPVFDSGGDRECLYYVMPYVEGETLRARLAREGRLPPEDALRIAREVGSALAYAHAHHVVHRDIKPENILLAQGHAMIADFGIARAIQKAGAERITIVGLTVGTPLYMSPEQARGEPNVDGRSDVFSLGCLLFEMLSGQAPHAADTPQSVLARKFTDVSAAVETTLVGVSPNVVSAIQRSLATQASDRITSADFVAMLSGAAGSLETTLAVPVYKRSTRRLRWALAAVTLVALGAVGALLVRGGASSNVAPERVGVAVFPFHSTDPASAQWEEAIPDLLATALDGVPGITVADPWSVWRDLRPDPRARAHSPAPEQATKLAERARASFYLLGTIAQIQREVQVNVRIYRVGRDEPWQTFSASGSVDSVMNLARQISLEAIRRLAQGGGRGTTLRIDHRLTNSPEALKAWLSARENRRRGELDSANAAIDRAISLDSTFVLAHIDAVALKSWLQYSRGEPYGNLRELAERAARLSDSTSERSHWHARAMLASINTHGAVASRSLDRVLAIDSTDFDAWSLMSYVQVAYGWQYGRNPSDAIVAAERAVRLDSTDAQALVRRAYLGVVSNDAGDIRRQVARLRASDTTIAMVRGMLIAIDALQVDDETFASRVPALAGASVSDWIATLRLLRLFRPDRADLLVENSRGRATPVGGSFAAGATMQLGAAQARWLALDSLRKAGALGPGDRLLDRAMIAGAIAGAGDERLARRSVASLSADLPPDSVLAKFETRPAWQDGWLIGAFHAMYGDTLLARRWVAALGTLPTKDARPERYTEALRADIEARLASRRGNRAEALALARRAYDAWDIHSENQYETHPEPAIRFQLASLLRASGEAETAAALFQSLIPPTTWMGFYTARAALELGEIREEARDFPTAQRAYLIASRLWDRGDSSVAALRERVRRGLQRTGEPGRR